MILKKDNKHPHKKTKKDKNPKTLAFKEKAVHPPSLHP